MVNPGLLRGNVGENESGPDPSTFQRGACKMKRRLPSGKAGASIQSMTTGIERSAQ
jgi:hypothetical protein